MPIFLCCVVVVVSLVHTKFIGHTSDLRQATGRRLEPINTLAISSLLSHFGSLRAVIGSVGSSNSVSSPTGQQRLRTGSVVPLHHLEGNKPVHLYVIRSILTFFNFLFFAEKSVSIPPNHEEDDETRSAPQRSQGT